MSELSHVHQKGTHSNFDQKQLEDRYSKLEAIINKCFARISTFTASLIVTKIPNANTEKLVCLIEEIKKALQEQKLEEIKTHSLVLSDFQASPDRNEMKEMFSMIHSSTSLLFQPNDFEGVIGLGGKNQLMQHLYDPLVLIFREDKLMHDLLFSATKKLFKTQMIHVIRMSL